MAVQDDSREQELCNLFNLVWDPDHARGGEDAWFEMTVNGKKVRVAVEVKSTTNVSISTARDVGMKHIRKWRGKIWVIGYYSAEASRGKPRLVSTLCLTPDEMEPWIAQVEGYIGTDFQIGELAAKKMTRADLSVICGEKKVYSLEDAKRLYKKQWKLEEYRNAMDHADGYSPERMLEILRQRAQYLMDRGATLNNPHIPKSFLKRFGDQLITHEHASRIREKFAAYFKDARH
ncbi:MAG: hypothetical protein K8H89_10115 [Flavobacteriales bacterium]|jgi:hypothetical protein|nr:hypothetical protein [Flavobacteriales bacterium]MCB0759301.1 hypothetical protein [Flavobacteriales bacterium]